MGGEKTKNRERKTKKYTFKKKEIHKNTRGYTPYRTDS
jgi:hypothetical protein